MNKTSILHSLFNIIEYDLVECYFRSTALAKAEIENNIYTGEDTND